MFYMHIDMFISLYCKELYISFKITVTVSDSFSILSSRGASVQHLLDLQRVIGAVCAARSALAQTVTIAESWWKRLLDQFIYSLYSTQNSSNTTFIFSENVFPIFLHSSSKYSLCTFLQYSKVLSPSPSI